MRLFLPREHGAYAQLAVPLVVGLALGSPSIAGALTALGAALVFWAHEPLLLLLGHRGERLRGEQGRPARVLLTVLGAAAVGALISSAFLARTEALWLLLPLGLGGAVLEMVERGKEKTAPGELLVVAALSSWLVPVALDGGTALRLALQGWLGLLVGFSLSTLAVRLVIQAGKRRAGGAARAAVAGSAIAAVLVLLLLSWLRELGMAVAGAVLPFALFAVALAAAPPHARNLKRIGWGLVGASLVASVVLVLGLRAG